MIIWTYANFAQLFTLVHHVVCGPSEFSGKNGTDTCRAKYEHLCLVQKKEKGMVSNNPYLLPNEQ